MTETLCAYCRRRIVLVDGRWIDPEATGDDSIWRETCDEHDTFVAEHEPRPLNTFYVLSPNHVTFHKFAVQAETLEEAQRIWNEHGSDGAEYVGYIDADWEDGPSDEWDESNSYVEGVG